jgi:hypothetical protein
VTPWWRPLVLGASCLVIGFVLGWMVRGDGGGPATVVAQGDTTEASEPTPPADTSTAPDDTATAPDDTSTSGTTVTAEDQTTPPAPGEVSVAVLNATSVTGLAAQTADELAAEGYSDVTTGNAPATTGASTVYYRAGAEAAAAQLAEDADAAGGTAPLPSSGELTDAVPAEAQVALVLGPG